MLDVDWGTLRQERLRELLSTAYAALLEVDGLLPEVIEAIEGRVRPRRLLDRLMIVQGEIAELVPAANVDHADDDSGIGSDPNPDSWLDVLRAVTLGGLLVIAGVLLLGQPVLPEGLRVTVGGFAALFALLLGLRIRAR